MLCVCVCVLIYLLFSGLARSSNSAMELSDEQWLLLLSTDVLLPRPALPRLTG